MTHLALPSKEQAGQLKKSRGGYAGSSSPQKTLIGRGGGMPKMPCLVCGKLTNGTSRCELHQKIWDDEADAKRRARKQATGQYSGDYKSRARMIRENAYVCHICLEGPRPNDPWQADHLVPGDPLSPLAAAHRSCNARRGNKPLE